MRIARRADSNRALEAAARRANELRLPLVCLEELDCADPWSSDRFHTFVLEGAPEQARRLAARGIGYVFHLRRRRTDAADVPRRLMRDAAEVVTDDHPLLPNVPGAEAVDSSCIIPFRRFGQREYAAYSFRPKVRRVLPGFLKPVEAVPLAVGAPEFASEFHTAVREPDIPALVAECEIDHSLPPARGIRGGRTAAEATLSGFLEQRLRRYAREKNEPSARAVSGLSPYLHYGQISSLEVALAVRRYAEEHKLIAEEFLEELIVRRELCFNFAWHSTRPAATSELPNWAQETLARHAADPRPALYTPAQFEAAETHDPLWNAAQRELLIRGVIHGYYRMYWGKKILEWSPTPQQAVSTMVRLNDRYALDGRDPNTYANILWCLGLHDRPWPERPVFGTVRTMTFEGMRRKTDVEAYIREIGTLS